MKKGIRWLGLALVLVAVLSLVVTGTPAPTLVPGTPVYASDSDPNPLLWDRTWGTSDVSTAPHDIAPDGQGNVYAVINSRSKVKEGALTAFLVKLNENGYELWRVELDQVYQRTFSISADKDGNVYAYGGALNRILTKYDPNGEALWTQGIETTAESAYVSADSEGNVYVTAQVRTNDGSPDWNISLIKYDTGGTQKWSAVISTDGDESAVGVAAGADGIFVAGKTDGSFPGSTFSGNGIDGFLARFSPDGTRQWVKQFGGIYFTDLATDSGNNAYVTATELYYGSPIIVSVARFDFRGEMRLIRNLPFDPTQHSSVAVDGWHNMYVAGAIDNVLSSFPDLRIEKCDAFGKLQFVKTINLGVGPFTVRTGKYGDIYTAYFADYPGSTGFQSHLVKYQGDEDSDGDGLPDRWEAFGVTVGETFVDLPALGARPDHKDIFVEVDWMPGQEPKAGALDMVVNAFRDAPVENPDKTTGINLHIDAGPSTVMNQNTGEKWGSRSKANQVANKEFLGSMSIFNNYKWGDFDDIKAANFDKSRMPIFHYALFANKLGDLGKTSGISKGLPGGDLVVSLGGWNGGTGGTPLQQAGTFMHELGHNLALRHGGVDDTSFKPNYLSVMNYAFQSSGLIKRMPDGVTFGEGNLDYSIFNDLNDLDTGALDETIGLASSSNNPKLNDYGTRYYWVDPFGTTGVSTMSTNGPHPIDWDGSGGPFSTSASAPYLTVGPNGNGEQGIRTLQAGGEDWQRLIYLGGSIGQLGATRDDLPAETPVITEFTSEDEEAQGHPYYVTVKAPANAGIQPGSSSISYTFTITNTGKAADTYSVTAGPAGGWADLSGFPRSVSLASGQGTSIPVSVTLPVSPTVDSDELTVIATSQTNARIWDAGTVRTVLRPQSMPAEERITKDNPTPASHSRFLPAIDGDWVVWQDTNQYSLIHIFAHNLVTGEDRPLTPNYTYSTAPDVSGNKVVYEHNSRVYLYDLSTNIERAISPADVTSTAPRIYGDKVVYASFYAVSQSYWAIMLYDLSTDAEQEITRESLTTLKTPDIYGDKIVWAKGNGVYLYDLGTATQRQISTSATVTPKYPRINGNRVVWTDHRNATWAIYAYDLSSEMEVRITSDSAGIQDPDNGSIGPANIFGDRIVWADDRLDPVNQKVSIYMYDLSSGTESQVTSNDHDQGDPAIYENRIVYWDKQRPFFTGYNRNIYMTTLPANQAPGTSLSTSPAAPQADGFFNVAPNITLTPDRTGASTFYQWDSSSNLGWAGYTGVFTATEGVHTLYYYSADALGNTESVKSKVFKVDTTAPATVISTTPSLGKVIGGVFKVVPQITLGTGEADSITYYQWDSISGTWNTYAGAFAGQEGEHTLHYYSVDSHGNTENIQSQPIKVDLTVDTTAPVTRISIDPALTAGETIYPSSPVVTLTVDGPAVTYYSWDAPMSGIPAHAALPIMLDYDTYATNVGSPTLYWGKFLAPEGTHTLYFFSVDASGNVEGVHSRVFVVGSAETSSFRVFLPVMFR